MKTLITTALAVTVMTVLGGRTEARDHCGGGHRHYGGHYHGGGHCHYGGYGGHYGGYRGGYYGGSCSTFSVGLFSPYYRSSYYSSPYYYRPAYYFPRNYYVSRSLAYYPTASRAYSSTAAVQLALARRGYYRGSIDGIIGPMSRSAIRQYQIDYGLPVTGGVDYSLARSLAVR